MTFDICVPTDDHWPELMRVSARAFGWVPDDTEIAQRRPLVDLTRMRVAMSKGRIVGLAASFPFDMTLPGGTAVPMCGVTWVSVDPTHRRQGILRALLDGVHADAEERGEPVATLYASEGGIYRRFGYGVGSVRVHRTIDRRAARLRDDLPAASAAVWFATDAAEAEGHGEQIRERTRRQRAGDVSLRPALAAFIAAERAKPEDDLSPAFFLLHPDGIAVYRIKEQWGAIPAHRLELDELAAATPEARLDLWRTLLSIDLVGTIESKGTLPADEPISDLLDDRRAVQVTAMDDQLWVRVGEPAVVFGARSYGTDDRLVVEAAGRRWAITQEGGEPSCRAVRARADLVTDGPGLGALLLGGIAPSDLAAGRRLDARSADVLRRADAFFVVKPSPHCSTFF